MGAGLALLERAVGYTLGSLRLVERDALRGPTPCGWWDLGHLLAHMQDSLLALSEAAGLGAVSLESDPGDHPDPVRALREHACLLVGEWARADCSGTVEIGGHPLSADVVAGAGAVEVAVHGWDVARACGTDRPIPDALARELLELCPLLVSGEDRPGRFAQPVDVSPLAGPGDRLLAFLGRDPA
ncbi:TIGR03086 family metal-binding protein [Prauserella cavernicola]|uniref:TIGR03086 family protein n=1 Tax=Prauserella cavernicola TaxID=2800127 RepID=A0A934V504_9PSEU|nr:TIGR03086 family metal-binding protein [Prauserella cavernicola]MBK1785259.1 TIGR03086 family protein [Prauserella cavernicola]